MPRWPLALLAAVLTAAPGVAGRPTAYDPGDFVEYWAAARVHAAGGNPYDGDQLLPWQRHILGDPDRTEAVMLWTPPWTLPLYAPFGRLNPFLAQLLWLAAQALLLVFAVAKLSDTYGRGRWWAGAVPFAVLLTSAEVPWLFVYGQNTGFVLAGLAGFLHFRTRGLPFAAGLAGALTAVKPHLLLPFATLLLLDARSRAGRRVLLGGVTALAAGSLLAMVPNRAIFADFAAALQAPSTAATKSVGDWQVPLLSYHLRLAIDPTQFLWQFAPAAVACLGYAAVRIRAATPWDWPARLPLVVLVSLLTAPYGAWVFDLVLLVVPATAMAFTALGTGRAVVVAAAAALHLLRYPAALKLSSLEDGWAVTPVALAGYLLVAALSRRADSRRAACVSGRVLGFGCAENPPAHAGGSPRRDSGR